MRTLKFFSLALSLLTVLWAGCGGPERPNMAPVSGVVSFQGQPLVGAQVSFHNDKSPRVASGVTDAQGKFTLTTFDPGDGAIIGEHRVSIAKLQGASELSSASAADPTAAYGSGMAAAASGKMSTLQKNELPAKFANPTSSGLTVTVSKEGPNEFPFDIKAE